MTARLRSRPRSMAPVMPPGSPAGATPLRKAVGHTREAETTRKTRSRTRVALPGGVPIVSSSGRRRACLVEGRSEEHTSELQSRGHLVCRLLLEKKNNSISTLGENIHRRESDKGHV